MLNVRPTAGGYGMPRQTEANAEPRTPLSKHRVLRAAIVLADAGGIEALSMRRLAKELGVQPMSLYNHVLNKDAILDGIIDAVASEIDLPSDEAGWKTAIRQSAISARNILVRHRWASSLWMSRGSGPARFRHADWMLKTLREAGFSKDLTEHAFHILQSHLLGTAFQQLEFPYKGQELAGVVANFLQQLPADEYPYLIEHAMQHLEPRRSSAGGFEFGLDLILDGLERIRDTAPSPSAGR
jgi:AcrR family transcriptional regulator